MVDLTHLLEDGMPVYPGTDAPVFSPANTMERDGFRETGLKMTSHTGTHMDAPAHMLPNGATLDALPVSRFCGKAVVIDVSRLRGAQITRAVLESCAPLLSAADFLLFRTGFEALWGTPSYCGEFAVPDETAAEYLLSFHLKGVGTDAISIDPIASEDFPNHLRLFRAGLVSIENLRLSALPEGELFDFCALPLHIKAADGAPVRAVAML